MATLLAYGSTPFNCTLFVGVIDKSQYRCRITANDVATLYDNVNIDMTPLVPKMTDDATISALSFFFLLLTISDQIAIRALQRQMLYNSILYMLQFVPTDSEM